MIAVALVLLNDGWMPSQGSEAHWASHPTVRMVRERVDVTINQGYAIVDCRFVFKNYGKACTVRMAFPDDSDTRDVEEKTSFKWFRTWVDGRQVPANILTIDVAQFDVHRWRVKDVVFGDGQARTVRDRYEVPNTVTHLIGSAIHGFDYILQTGSTWNGLIEKSEVVVKFSSNYPAKLLKLVPMRRLPELSGDLTKYEKFWRARRNWVGYSGPCEPKVIGRTIRFVRTRWKPDSDISLVFGWRADTGN